MNTKGHVSNVKLSPTLIANGSAVTIVWLLNLNLQPQAENIPQMLPPKIQYLALDNGLFTELPKGLDAFPSLKALYVGWLIGLRALCLYRPQTHRHDSMEQVLPHQLREERGLDVWSGRPHGAVRRRVCVVQSHPSILTLLMYSRWLSENNLESFTAVFPKLQTLCVAGLSVFGIAAARGTEAHLMDLIRCCRDLALNNLDEIPEVLASYTSLQTLYVADECVSFVSIDAVTFSQTVTV